MDSSQQWCASVSPMRAIDRVLTNWWSDVHKHTQLVSVCRHSMKRHCHCRPPRLARLCAPPSQQGLGAASSHRKSRQPKGASNFLFFSRCIWPGLASWRSKSGPRAGFARSICIRKLDQQASFCLHLCCLLGSLLQKPLIESA